MFKREIVEFDSFSFLGTVEIWLDKIANYLLERITSGFVEGFNNRVKVLKRRCYGIFEVERIFNDSHSTSMAMRDLASSDTISSGYHGNSGRAIMKQFESMPKI